MYKKRRAREGAVYKEGIVYTEVSINFIGIRREKEGELINRRKMHCLAGTGHWEWIKRADGGQQTAGYNEVRGKTSPPWPIYAKKATAGSRKTPFVTKIERTRGFRS